MDMNTILKHLGIFSVISLIFLSFYVLKLEISLNNLGNSAVFLLMFVVYLGIYHYLIKYREQIATNWLFKKDALNLVIAKKKYYASNGWDDKDPINNHYEKLDKNKRDYIDEKIDKKVHEEKWPNLCDSLMAFTTSVFILVFFIMTFKDYLTVFLSTGYCLAMFGLLIKNYNDMKKSYTIEQLPMFKVE